MRSPIGWISAETSADVGWNRDKPICCYYESYMFLKHHRSNMNSDVTDGENYQTAVAKNKTQRAKRAID